MPLLLQQPSHDDPLTFSFVPQQLLHRMADDDDAQVIQPDLVVGHESEPNEVSYNKRDLIIYALGIG